MDRWRYAHQFRGTEHYDQRVEAIFEKLYMGNKTEFSSCCDSLIYVLEQVMYAGYLTLGTYRYMKKILGGVYSDQDEKCIVISCDNEKITVLNPGNDTQDSFMLSDMITWFVEMLIGDPYFRNALKGHNNYAGVIKCLHGISTRDRDSRAKLSIAKHIVSYGSFLYLICKMAGELKLVRVDKKLSGSMAKMEEIMPLSTADLFYDRRKNSLYVNHADGLGRRIPLEDHDDEEITLIQGKIIHLTDQGQIVFVRGTEIFLDDDGKEVKIGHIDDTILNTYERNGISWISTANDQMTFHCYREGEICLSHSLKAEILWRYILKSCYMIRKDTNRKMSSILWTYQCCQTPLPFTVEKIQNTINLLEKGLYQGMGEKSPKYSSIMGPILKCDEDNGDLTDRLFDFYQIQTDDISTIMVEIWESVRCISPGDTFFYAKGEIVLPGDRFLYHKEIRPLYIMTEEVTETTSSKNPAAPDDETDKAFEAWPDEVFEDIEKRLKELEIKEKKKSKLWTRIIAFLNKIRRRGSTRGDEDKDG